MSDRIVLAYSGGLDTSVCIGWLAEETGREVVAVALDDGRAVAVKIADGAMRASYVVMSAVLQRLGLDAPVLDELSRPPLLGGSRPVGEIWPMLPTASLA